MDDVTPHLEALVSSSLDMDVRAMIYADERGSVLVVTDPALAARLAAVCRDWTRPSDPDSDV